MFFSLDNFLRNSNNNDQHMCLGTKPKSQVLCKNNKSSQPLRHLSRHLFRVQVSLYAKHNAEVCTDECAQLPKSEVSTSHLGVFLK